jgi:hypothetical protein
MKLIIVLLVVVLLAHVVQGYDLIDIIINQSGNKPIQTELVLVTVEGGKEEVGAVQYTFFEKETMITHSFYNSQEGPVFIIYKYPCKLKPVGLVCCSLYVYDPNTGTELMAKGLIKLTTVRTMTLKVAYTLDWVVKDKTYYTLKFERNLTSEGVAYQKKFKFPLLRDIGGSYWLDIVWE